MDKRSVRCTKGKQLREWFEQEKSQKALKKLKVPQVDELPAEQIAKLVIESFMKNGVMHATIKKDKRKLVYPVKSQSWDEKHVYVWDYDGPAV